MTRGVVEASARAAPRNRASTSAAASERIPSREYMTPYAHEARDRLTDLPGSQRPLPAHIAPERERPAPRGRPLRCCRDARRAPSYGDGACYRRTTGWLLRLSEKPPFGLP